MGFFNWIFRKKNEKAKTSPRQADAIADAIRINAEVINTLADAIQQAESLVLTFAKSDSFIKKPEATTTIIEMLEENEETVKKIEENLKKLQTNADVPKLGYADELEGMESKLKHISDQNTINKMKVVSERKAVSALTSAINDLITEALQSYKREVKKREPRIEELTTRLRDLKDKHTQDRTVIDGLLAIIEDLNHIDNKNEQILIELSEIAIRMQKYRIQYRESAKICIEELNDVTKEATNVTDRIEVGVDDNNNCVVCAGDVYAGKEVKITTDKSASEFKDQAEYEESVNKIITDAKRDIDNVWAVVANRIPPLQSMICA